MLTSLVTKQNHYHVPPMTRWKGNNIISIESLQKYITESKHEKIPHKPNKKNSLQILRKFQSEILFGIPQPPVFYLPIQSSSPQDLGSAHNDPTHESKRTKKVFFLVQIITTQEIQSFFPKTLTCN